MAQNLEVKYREAIPAQIIAKALGKKLSLILGVTHNFKIEIMDKSSNVVGKDSSIGSDVSAAFSVCLPDFDVSVGLYPQRIIFDSRDNVLQYFSIVVEYSREPLEYCLAAALAISIAGLSEDAITDSACFWVDKEDFSADSFTASVAIEGDNKEILDAADTFYGRLNFQNAH